MTTFANVFYDTPNGLVPYLESTLAGDWSKFQLRRIDSITQGFRPVDDSVQLFGKYQRDRIVTQSVRLGWMIDVNNTTPDSTVATAMAFRDSIDSAIFQWRNTAGEGLVAGDILAISGSYSFTQRQNATGWIIAIVREFDVPYFAS